MTGIVKKLSTFFQLIFFPLCFFSLQKINAQNCEPNLLKALEQTRVTFFDKVTKGEVGHLFIKFPMDGVTYTFTDQNGQTYTYTHTGAGISADVAVGTVDAERRFALKAEKDGCVYQTTFAYKLTPETALGIAVRVEDEWCASGGALYYRVVGTGANNSNYDFFHRKAGGNYRTFASPVTGASSLDAGTYEVKAQPKSGTPAVAERTGIQLKGATQTIAFNLTYLPEKCASQGAGINITVTSGNYPLTFELLDNSGNAIPSFPRQVSNVFTNVPPGNYKVRVLVHDKKLLLKKIM